MAIRIDKIYTKFGDKGKTRLVGGLELSKGALSVECLGTVEEVNSFLGFIRSSALEQKSINPRIAKDTEKTLRKIQNDLFDIGRFLTLLGGNEILTQNKRSPYKISKNILKNVHTKFLEEKIDFYGKDLKPLASFVLPGGSKPGVEAHLARTACRRLERILIRWHEETPIDPGILAYVNRLSDFLFAYSRWVVQELGEEEFLWAPS